MFRRTPLDPLPLDRLRTVLRGRGWPRTMALRRVVAVALVVLAGALALRPAGAREATQTDVVVAAKDMAPGSLLSRSDVAIRSLPGSVVPSGALTDPEAATGRVLSGPVRAGEPLTDVRLVGPADTALTTGDPNAATVPVRLADPDVADLLRPGIRVDVVTLDPDHQSDPVLAENATVVTVRDTSGSTGGVAGTDQNQNGRLVLVALPRQYATRLAAASLRQPVTVTLR
ncbi:MAG TPA: Flp pilus assembly protein CpaB [Pseudonocardiaceae bacterium]|nr:Flp pilus assembly protein CpaB [Pseudonocardiaceae bacterium]